MGDVVQLSERRPHISGMAFCTHCDHRFAAVAPAGTAHQWLECPACHTEKALYQFPCCLPAGGLVRTCDCGNQLFYLTPAGHLCPNCGTYQQYGP